MKEIINKNKRKSIEQKIKAALDRKPSGNVSQSIVYNDLKKQIVGEKSPKATQIQKDRQQMKILNSRRGGLKILNPPPPKSVSLHVVMSKIPTPNPKEYTTPTWFHNNGKIDVSIIVPLYKSQNVIKEQIASWDVADDGLNKEIIYVDDCCPNKSYSFIIDSWSKRTKSKGGVGKVILNDVNSGYAMACNVGARFASGKYLIFLNADCKVTPNWIKPLFDRMESDSTIGICGNMQLKMINNAVTIDSAGSEWSWNTMCFDHIARHCYHGKPIPSPFELNMAPMDCKTAVERDMVTGCCFIIPNVLFKEIDGFDYLYRVGYWEDSDINMKVKSAGYKVFYEPESKIWHEGGHSGAGGHSSMNDNVNRFFRKWVHNGNIDGFVSSRRTLPTPKEIFIRRRAAHGDVLVAASVCSAIKKKFPQCRIVFDTITPDILKFNPYIDKLVMDQNPKAYPLAYDLDFAYENRPKIHILRAYAEEVGVDVKDCKMFINTQSVSNLPKKYVVFCPGNTAWVGRNWDNKKFEEIAEVIKSLGYTIISAGKEGDRGIACADYDYRGKTNLYQFAEIIKNSNCFIGIDSFPMWIAQTFNVPGICFFGCIDPKLRIINSNMYGINAASLPCIGCHHEQPIPCVGTSSCRIGQTLCETNVTAEMFIDKFIDMNITK